MTYIVNDECIKCKYMDCVEVCPVDCFYEGENMLVIHPDEWQLSPLLSTIRMAQPWRVTGWTLPKSR